MATKPALRSSAEKLQIDANSERGKKWASSRRWILIGATSALACGGLLVAGVVLYVRATKFSYTRTNNATEIRKLTSDIADIEVPAPLAPFEATEHTWPLTSKKTMTRVTYTSPGPRSVLAICGLERETAGENIGQLRVILESGMRQWNFNMSQLLNLRNTPVTREINGKPSYFEIIEATTPNGSPVYIARGDFEGRHGGASLLLVAGPDQLSLESIAKMIDSIK